MSLFGKNIKEAGEGVKEAFSGITDFVDKTFTSKEEKAQILAQINDAENKVFELVQNNISERHKNDMLSDNKLSKNIRPLTLIFLLLLLLTVIVLKTVFVVEVPEAYLEVMNDWGGLAIGFYFGSRAIEKTGGIANAINSVIKRKNDK
jgi:hypothetical protein